MDDRTLTLKEEQRWNMIQGLKERVFNAAMAWQDAERRGTRQENVMLIAVDRRAWPAFLAVIEDAWKARGVKP